MAADLLPLAPAPGACPTALRRNWGWLVGLGAVLVLAGTAAILSPYVATVLSVQVFGVFLLVAAGAEFGAAFWARGWQGVLLAVLVGLLYLFSGIVLVERTVWAAGLYTLFLAMYFFASGVVRVVVAVGHRFHGWGWAVLGGVVNLVLAGLIWQSFPEDSLWVIGTFVGIDLLFTGWTWVALGLAAKRLPTPAAA